MDVFIDHELRFVPPPALLEPLRKRVTWPNPERAAMARRGRYAGAVPADWCALDVRTGDAQARLPRGLLPQLQEAAREAQVDVQWVPRVTWDPAARRVPLTDLHVELRDYQIEAVDQCVSKRQGVVVLPCGAGKSTVGSALILSLNQRAVIVTPSVDIAEQWVATLRRLRPEALIRVVHGGVDWSGAPLAPGEIAVGVDDSLATDRARPLLRSAGVLVTDETHRIASKTWRGIVACCPARWRIGLTATPERADGWDMLLPCLLGPVILERSQQWLVSRGYLAQPTVYPVATGAASASTDYRWSVVCPRCRKEVEVEEAKVRAGMVRCPKIVQMSKRRRDVCGEAFPPDIEVTRTFSVGRAGSRVASDPERLELVRRICAWAMPRDRDVLVLVPRVAAVARLVKLLVADGVRAVGLTGSESRKVREAALAALGRREYRVLVATQLADEGLDLPRMDTLVNTSAGVAAGNAAQRVGRVCRPCGNAPLVFDFVDGGDNYGRQWRARSLAYRKAYGEVAVPERKPIPLRDALARCEVKGEPGRMF